MKNYLVVGGSSGIGKALVDQLVDEGHNVFFTFNNTKVDSSSNKTGFHYDVFSNEDITNQLPERLDGFVYCPGSIKLMPFARMKEGQLMDDFKLQVMGAVNSLQQVLPRLKKSDDASVVFFSTVAVQTGFKFHSQVAMSKGAVEGLTRTLAAELAPAIRVNAIAPSLTDTPLAERLLNTVEKKQANAERHPLKRIGSPENIADTVNFLLSDKSSWITGQILAVDGGISSIVN